MRTFVKFTGLTSKEAVAAVPDGGAAGFVVGVPRSPRNLPPDVVTSLLDHLPNGVEAWAVVSDPTTEEIHRLFEEVGIDRVQVHGAVPPDLEFLEIHHLVPSLAVPLRGDPGADPRIPPADDYPRLDLDAAGDPLADGHAVLADWERCQRIVDGQPGRKLTLSGGITGENVVEALEQVRPWGVGVCSGVESAPGRADPARMIAFLDAIRNWESGGGPA
jgi:phosphoribosylanthranilate isomerase